MKQQNPSDIKIAISWNLRYLAAQRVRGISVLGDVLQVSWIRPALSRELDQVTSEYPFQPYNL